MYTGLQNRGTAAKAAVGRFDSSALPSEDAERELKPGSAPVNQSPEKHPAPAPEIREADRTRKDRPRDSAGFVYFAEAALTTADGLPLIKIGFATDYERRINLLRTGCPAPLRLRGVIKDADAVSLERRLHRRFKKWRFRGEWFAGSAELMAYISAAATVPAPTRYRDPLLPSLCSHENAESLGTDGDGVTRFACHACLTWAAIRGERAATTTPAEAIKESVLNSIRTIMFANWEGA